jgi:16S rRNA (guanine(966)-N(2))-methyltransferase RsmD
VRIISGSLKGRRVTLPRGSRARPVTGMVLELAMNLFGPGRLAGAIFADLCAGSGLVGFEAVSRGAELAYLVEADARQARQLAATARDFDVESRVSILRTDARRCFSTIQKGLPGDRRLNAVFIDPPYIPGMARELITALGSAADCGNLLEPDALVVLRTPDHLDETEGGQLVDGLAFLEKRPAGSAKLWLYGPASGV